MSSPPPEIRIDQLTGLRAILAPARAERPLDWDAPPAPVAEAPPEGCPFCEGNEGKTPLEVWADRPGSAGADSPGWRVRAVPNLYPALDEAEDAGGPAGRSEGKRAPAAPADPLRASSRAGEPDLFGSLSARGSHEVVIHSPRHRRSLAELDDGELAAAVAGWRARMRAHSGDAACVQLIVNEGEAAGASLEHSHAQLYALGFVPVAVARERERFGAYNERTMGGDLLADIGSEEVRRRDRLVAIDDEAMVICPWASRSPFELRVIPRRAAARFESDKDVGVAALGTALRALAARFGGRTPALNLWVRTAPRGTEIFHWRIDIAPRLATRAGFELSTGVEINIFPPERAAAELREALGAAG